jgi:C_GCAxxG_C_C family probable redox protein
MNKGKIAREYFEQGYNCAQAVFTAFKEETGLDEKTALRLSSAFGGGIAGMRETCGAVSGMLMAFGALKGYDAVIDADEKKAFYENARALAEEFKALHSTLNCAELLKSHEIVPTAEPSNRDEEYYRKRPCARYVEACANLLNAKL